MNPEPPALLYVVDTHVLIWHFTGNKRLPEKLKSRIDQIRLQGGRLLVPTIVLAEALAVAAKMCCASSGFRKFMTGSLRRLPASMAHIYSRGMARFTYQPRLT